MTGHTCGPRYPDDPPVLRIWRGPRGWAWRCRCCQALSGDHPSWDAARDAAVAHCAVRSPHQPHTVHPGACACGRDWPCDRQ